MQRLTRVAIVTTALVIGAAGPQFLAAQGNLKIGLIVPLTGPAAMLGNSSVQGAKLAVDAVNAAGGVHGKSIELAVADSSGDPSRAARAAEWQVREGVSAIIGDVTSANTLAASHFATSGGIPLITAHASGLSFSDVKSPYLIKLTPSLPTMYKSLGVFAGQKLGLRTCALATISTTMGRAIAAGFTEGFAAEGRGRIVLDLAYHLWTSDFSDIAEAIKQGRPDCIVLTGLGRDSGLLVKAVRARGVTAKILGSVGQSAPDFRNVAGDAAEGVTLVTPYDPLLVSSEHASKFRALWKTKNETEPDYLAATSYDAVWLIASAAQSAGASPKSIARGLYGVEFTGASGPIKLLPQGEARRDLAVQVWEGGKLVGKEAWSWPRLQGG
jgi:branched-chain amino acid transport system substrate-binding protein